MWGGYVSLDDMFFLPCLMYIHILPNCCFIFQMFQLLLFTLKKTKKKKNEVEYMRSCFEDLDWFEDLVEFVDIGGFGFTFYA